MTGGPGGARFVSIATTSYSGATLLAMLLGHHPGLATVGELNGIIAAEDPAAYRCSCGRLILECPFWARVTARLAAAGTAFDVRTFDLDFDLGGPRLVRRLRTATLGAAALDRARDAVFLAWPAERAAWRRRAARNEAVIRAVLAETGASVLVDSSKDPLRLEALRRFSGLDVQAIHLVRDARGVVASRLRRGVPVSPGEAARQWARQHARIERRLTSLPPERRIRVRYEDLVREPDRTLRRLWAFCGLDAAAVPPGSATAAATGAAASPAPSEQHVLGNAMRLDPVADIRLDERWRALPRESLLAIEQVAGRAQRRFGYGADGATA